MHSLCFSICFILPGGRVFYSKLSLHTVTRPHSCHWCLLAECGVRTCHCWFLYGRHSKGTSSDFYIVPHSALYQRTVTPKNPFSFPYFYLAFAERNGNWSSGSEQTSTIWRSVKETQIDTTMKEQRHCNGILGIFNEVQRHTLKSLVSVKRYMLQLEPGLCRPLWTWILQENFVQVG